MKHTTRPTVALCGGSTDHLKVEVIFILLLCTTSACETRFRENMLQLKLFWFFWSGGRSQDDLIIHFMLAECRKFNP